MMGSCEKSLNKGVMWLDLSWRLSVAVVCHISSDWRKEISSCRSLMWKYWQTMIMTLSQRHSHAKRWRSFSSNFVVSDWHIFLLSSHLILVYFSVIHMDLLENTLISSMNDNASNILTFIACFEPIDSDDGRHSCFVSDFIENVLTSGGLF